MDQGIASEVTHLEFVVKLSEFNVSLIYLEELHIYHNICFSILDISATLKVSAKHGYRLRLLLHVCGGILTTYIQVIF